MLEVTSPPSGIGIVLLQQRSITIGGLVGIGFPHWTTVGTVEQSRMGGEGTKLTTCVQIVLLPQQLTAFQINETEPAHPAELVLLPIRLTCTALQQAEVAVGGTGGTGIGPLQGIV
jgi:hypothetical protein